MSSVTRTVRTSCRMCHGVCQVLVEVQGDRVVKVAGDPDSPTSRGYICPKGKASVELLYHPDRLKYPLRRVGKKGEDKWERITWDEAVSEISGKLAKIKSEFGPEYFALMQGTGRPYTVFNARFANGFGTPNFVAPGHICFFPRVSASGITMGGLPISDIYGLGGQTPACMIIWGCNIPQTGAADGMCGNMLQKAAVRAKELIVVDPRRTTMAEKAQHWACLKPGTDGALALALLNVVVTEELIDREFVNNYTSGYDELVTHIQSYTPEWASAITGIEAEDIKSIARIYATTKPASIHWGNGMDMSLSPFHTARALLILRAITGNIDRPGGDVLWVSPDNLHSVSPLVNQDILGMDWVSPEKRALAVDGGRYRFVPFVHPPTFWRSIVEAKPYRVKAVWIVGSNPLLTHTNTETIEKALDLLDFLVVSDFFLTPTAKYADIVLPAATWLEQDDIANFHKIWCVLSRTKITQIGEVRDDREVILDVAKRLGMDKAFPWNSLDAYLNWVFEDADIDFKDFTDETIRLGDMQYFKYKTEGFHTPSGKFEIYSKTLESMGVDPLPVFRELEIVTSPDYPYILTTAKVREFFHSEGRQLPSLRQANPHPLIEIHPKTARTIGIEAGDWVWVETRAGKRIRMKARLFDGLSPNVVSAQPGWWFPEEPLESNNWKRSNVNYIIEATPYDPETGSESLRNTVCKLYKAE